MPRQPSSKARPPNWPPQIHYLRNPDYSPTLTPSNLKELRSPPSGFILDPSTNASSSNPNVLPSNTPKGPSSFISIRPITDPQHPACGQHGLFATRDLAPGTFILEYLGTVHCSPPKTLSDPLTSSSLPDKHAASDYDLSLDRLSGLGIDAECRGNEARFINDYRGVGAAPNAEFREIWVSGRNVVNDAKIGKSSTQGLRATRADIQRGERGTGVFVLGAGKGKARKEVKTGRIRGIKKGEEILVSYGRGFWGARQLAEAADVDEETCEAG